MWHSLKAQGVHLYRELATHLWIHHAIVLTRSQIYHIVQSMLSTLHSSRSRAPHKPCVPISLVLVCLSQVHGTLCDALKSSSQAHFFLNEVLSPPSLFEDESTSTLLSVTQVSIPELIVINTNH